MPGAFRPFTLVDVLSTLNDQSTVVDSTLIDAGLGLFSEVDETVPLADSMTTTVQAPPTWDSGCWGSTSWH